jgi:O-antigen/teichoic acid export membrane protein
MLGAIKDDRVVGLYALAVTLIELTNLVTDAVSTAVLQRQTNLPLEESGRFTAQVVGLSGVLAVLAATGLLATSPTLVPLVFGEDFRGTLPALFALAPGVVASLWPGVRAAISCGVTVPWLTAFWHLWHSLSTWRST